MKTLYDWTEILDATTSPTGNTRRKERLFVFPVVPSDQHVSETTIYRYTSSEDRMNRSDSATTFRQHQGALSWRSLLATFLVLLTVGVSAGVAQTATLSHVPGVVCSGTAPTLTLAVAGIPAITTYNVANPAWPGLEAEEGGAGTANNINVVGNPFGADEVRLITAAEITAEEAAGFNFVYYGSTHNLAAEGIYVSSNGFIRFSDGNPLNNNELTETGIVAQNIPAAAGPNHAIYFLNIDIDPQAADDVDWDIQPVNGVGAVNNALVVTFRAVSQYNPNLVYPYNQVTVQVILYGSTHALTPNRIEVRLENFPDPGVIPARNHTIGIENLCGAAPAYPAIAPGAHNNATWANGQVPVGGPAVANGGVLNTAWTWDPVAGLPQAYSARLVNVGTNGIIDTYDINGAAQGDDSYVNAIVAGSPVLLPATAISATTRYAAIVQFGSNCEQIRSNVQVITVNPVPVAQTIGGPANLCQGSTQNFTVAGTVPGSTFLWATTAPGAIVTPSGGQNLSASINFPGGGTLGGSNWNVSAQEIGPAPTNCSITSNKTITIFLTPSGVIAGPTPQCATGSSGPYTFSGAGAGITYNWTLSGAPAGSAVTAPSGSNTNITWGTLQQPSAPVVATLQLIATTGPAALCSSGPITYAITVNPMPVAKLPLTEGDATPCVNQQVTYSVVGGVVGNSYAWTLSAGGTFAGADAAYIPGTPTVNKTSMVIAWATPGSKSITITETTGAGCSVAYTHNLTQTVQANPAPVVNGSNTPCQFIAPSGTNPTYQTTPNPLQFSYTVNVPNALNTYTWTVNNGGQIVATNFGAVAATNSVNGVGITQVIVQWPNTGAATVVVTEVTPATYSCSGTSTFNLTVQATPNAGAFTLTGNGIAPGTDPCANSTGNVYTVTLGADNHTFNIIGGTITASTGAFTASTTSFAGLGNFTVTWGAGTTGSISHEYANLAGCSAVETYTINIVPRPNGNISGPNAVCGGALNQNYTVVNNTIGGPIASHSWTITAGGGFVASSVGAGTPTFTVNYNNSGTGVVTIQDVITGPAPSNCTTTLTYNVNVTQTPAPPTYNAGTLTPCAGATVVYTLNGTAGLTTTVTSVTNGTIVGSNNFVGAVGNITITWGLVPTGGAGSFQYQTQNGACVSGVTTTNVTINALPTVPVITITPNITTFCVSSPFPFLDVTSTSGAGIVSFAWSGSGGLTGVQSDVPAGAPINDRFTINNFGGVGTKVITVTATDGNGCTRSNTITLTIEANPTPVISGPNTACQELTDPLLTPAGPFTFANSNVYSTPLVAGHYYSWTSTNGYIVAYSTNSGGTWTPIAATTTTGVSAILGASQVRVAWYGVNPGKIKVSELNGPVSPPSCQTTTLDYNVTLNVIPLAQTIGVTPQNICAGSTALLTQGGSQAGYTYRLEVSTNAGGSWSAPGAVATQAGTGAALAWNIPASVLAYTAVAPNVTDYRFRVTAQTNGTFGTPAVNCGWYVVTPNAQIFVNPQPAVVTPAIVTTLSCQGDLTGIQVNVPGSQTWVLYTLGRRQIRDFAGNPIVPGAFVSIPSSTLAGNGGTITLTDATFPAGGNPLLNADNYEYQVTGVTDMTLAPPPNIACTTVMPTTVTTRVFALPTAQVVSFTANPVCFNQDVLVTLTNSQDGVTYEIRRNGLSMAPVVEVQGAVGGGPVSVWIPKLSVLASNPAAPTVVNFDVRARLRTVGGGVYARPTPASNCPFVFGATAVTVNPKPVANITGATTVCGPSNQVYTAGPSAVPATTTYDWLITGAPAGTTPTVANNTGLGTINPLNVAWGVNNLSCNGVYNPVTATIRLIETNAFACADTTTRTITVNPTIADAAITSADGNSQACIYGGFESHLETYTLNRPVSCVFPVNTTFLWTMPTGAVSGVIRSGQNTNSIVAEWNTTGGTNIGVVSCVVTLPSGLGGCSTTYTFNETVYPLPQPVVNGPISVCQNQAGVIYTADVYPTDTYNWEVVGGLISGGAGLGTIASPATRSGLSLTSITVNWLDTPNNNAYVKLRQVSAAGCQNTTTRFVTVNPTPTPVVNGPDAVCDNRAYTYTTQNNAPSSSFLWTVIGNASITNGANTASATVQTTVAGSFTVTVTETILATNCSKSASKTVTIVTAPTPTITRTAPAGGTVGGACLNQTVTYTVSPVVAGRSYSWSAVNGTIVSGQGTSSINVNWTVVGNGSVTLNEWVTATQCTTTVNQNVTVAGPPTPSINGPNTVCGLSVVTYSTQFVAGNTYAWSLPTNGVITAGAATNACTVTWNNPLPNVVNPATLSVTETNTLSGCFATANLNVSVYYKPVSPAITRVTGSPLNQACNNSTIQYQIPNNAGSNYLWTVTGGTITAGGSSNIVTVQWTSVGNQTLTVTETNGLNASCSGLSTLNVSVTYQPTPSISGNATTCTTNTDTYTTGNVAGSTYAWTLPSGGGTILSGAASNTITVNWTGAGARTVQVVETNGNCSATATLNVTVGQTPTATAILRLIPAGSLGSACVGSTITYATTLTAGNNYAWTVTGGSFSGSNSGVNVNTANVVWNVVGTQTLTVVETTAGTNCSKTATQLVNVTYQPTPSISGAATTCTGNTETYSTGNVAGDTYAWTVSAGGTILTGAGSSSITVRWTANGPQTVSVLETATAGGCFASATLNVTVGQTPTLTAISRVSGSPLAQACAGSTVGYTTPGTAGNTYVWSVTGGTFTGASNGVNVNTVNVTWNVLGNQTLTVVETTAGTNCSRTATQNVSVTYQPSPSISGNATTCTNNVETYTTANVAGSAYVWTITPSANGTILSGAASNTISVRWNNAGSATVSVLETSNPGGCFATANLVVSVGQTPTTTAIARTTPVGDVGKACVGQTITYSTQNNVGNTYAWLATGGSITGASNTNTVSVLWNIIGTGTLRVTETTVGTNCSRTVVQNVDVTYTPTPVISGSTVACLNTIQTYSTPAVAGSTYFWSISAANSFAPVAGFPTSNSITVQWIQPGLQTITLTETASGGGCATTVTRQVQVNPIPTPSISSTTGYGSPVSQRPGLVCAGSTHVYTTFATPANVWNWVVTGGTIIGGQNTNTITVTWSTGAGGSVQVTETVPGSTCVTTVKDSIIIKPIPTPNITSATGGVPNVCANSVHTYTTPNVVGNSWVWTVTGGSIISGGGSNTITVQWGAAGPGTVAVTETVLGVTPVCATSTSRAITVNPNPNAPIITGPSPVCATNLNTTPQTINTATYSSNITSTPAAISTYTWSVSSNGQIVTNATTSIGVQWFNTTTVPQNGTVTLTHTNIFGCSTTSSISVTINPNPTPSISGPNSVCQNTIQSYGTPGVPGNTYAWTITGGIIRGGQGTPNVQVEWTLPGGGTLTVSERNTFNCTVLNTLNVTINQLPTARVTASGPTTFCQGGDVTLSAPLGFASYAWNTGETGRNIVANRTGLYWVVVTDNNGCSNSSDSIQVNVFPTTLPIITASGPRTFCEGGSVTLTAPAGFSIYRWSNGATTRSITVTTSGEYTVAIADTNGCTGTSTPVEVIVYAKPQPVLTTIGSTTLCANDSVTVTAPAGYNSYTWSSSAGTNYGTARSIVVDQTDNITVSVVDINGCVGTSDTVKITLKPAISPVVTANGPLTFCEGNAVTLSAPTGFNSYYWSNGATTREITVADGGKYTVTVTDNSRCEATSPDLNVKVNLLPARPTINRTGDTLKAISSVADAYQWYRNGTMITGATNQKLIVALPGTYRVEIMDDNTCSSMSQPFDVILTDVNDDVVAGHTNGLEIFPNPTNGMFTVSATTSEAGSVRIELFNLVGEKVLSVNDMAQGGQFKSTVDMGQLASGVYNVVVTTNNERWTVRLVRQ
jgi:hypothetical protein